MIDIHPPQHAPMTRREFFTHLGIVVLGILIAIGLEQAVELLHQHQQVREARLMLRQELAQNRTILAHDMTNVDNHLSTLYNDLAVVARARDHKSLPGDQIVHIFGSVPFQAEAWQTIHASNVSEHMDPDELAEYGALYQKQQTISDMLTNANDQLQVSLSPLVASEDLHINPRVDTSAQIEEIESHTDTAQGLADAIHLLNHDNHPDRLTPAQLDSVEQALLQGIVETRRLQRFFGSLGADYANFRPAP